MVRVFLFFLGSNLITRFTDLQASLRDAVETKFQLMNLLSNTSPVAMNHPTDPEIVGKLNRFIMSG